MFRLLIVLAMVAVPAGAQQASFVTMTGTNASYPGGTMTANFLAPANSSQFDYLKYHFPFTVSAPLDGSGHWAMSLADTSSVMPVNSQWRLQLCSAATSGAPTCYSVTTAVTCSSNPSCSGSTLDLTSTFAAAPTPGGGGAANFPAAIPFTPTAGGTPVTAVAANVTSLYKTVTVVPNVILNTVFNEGTPGATLIGTAPSVGPFGQLWQIAAGDPTATASFKSGGGLLLSAQSPGPTQGAFIDIGMTDYTLKTSITNYGGNFMMVMLRYTDANSLVFANLHDGDVVDMYDWDGNNANPLATVGAAHFDYKNLQFELSGDSISVSSPGRTPLVVTDSLRHGTKVGYTLESGANAVIASLNISQGSSTVVSPCAGALFDDGKCYTVVPNVAAMVSGNATGKNALAMPELGTADNGDGTAKIAWAEDRGMGKFDCRNPKYGPGGCLGGNPQQALQDLSNDILCYQAQTGGRATVTFPPGRLLVGTPTQPTLRFPTGANYYGQAGIDTGVANPLALPLTEFQATYNNVQAVAFNFGNAVQTVCPGTTDVVTANMEGGNYVGLGEHGCADSVGSAFCRNVPGDTASHPNGGPGQTGLFIGDSQGYVDRVGAAFNGGDGVEIGGLDSHIHEVWSAHNMWWYLFGRHSGEIPPPSAVTATPSTTGGALPAGTNYYKVTSTTVLCTSCAEPIGESTGSVEVNAVTTGTTGSVALTWPAVTGATGYRIYRGSTPGGEGGYYTSATNSFTDVNDAGTGGAVPTFNTTNYGPGNDGSHGQAMFTGVDNVIDGPVETYGSGFDPSQGQFLSNEYGHIFGIVWGGGNTYLGPIFVQLDEIGVLHGAGSEKSRGYGWRIEGTQGEGYLEDSGNTTVQGLQITSACTDALAPGLMALLGGPAHCSYLDDRTNNNYFQGHTNFSPFFGPVDLSTSKVWNQGISTFDLIGATYLSFPGVEAGRDQNIIFHQAAEANGGTAVTGPTPSVIQTNKIYPIDAAPINYTTVTDGLIMQDVWIMGGGQFGHNVTLLAPEDGGNFITCSGHSLNLAAAGQLHFMITSGTTNNFGNPATLTEQCDPPNTTFSKVQLTAPAPASSTPAGGCVAGSLWADDSFIYHCSANGTTVTRAPLAAF